MPKEANGFVKLTMPKEMFDDGVGALMKMAEDRRWFGKLKYPADRPRFEFTFRFGICQCFTTLFSEGNAAFYMNTNNENVDFGK